MMKPANPDLQKAMRIAFAGVICVSIAISWGFFGAGKAMFGVAEAFAVIGMLMIMGAAWKAAEATIGDER